jgi:hypothetical protein
MAAVHKSVASKPATERRVHRRLPMENHNLQVQRIDRRAGQPVAFGQLMDISASGVRIRVNDGKLEPQRQLRIRLQLPTFGMIAPFLSAHSRRVQPSNDWTGWMEVCRVHQVDEYHWDVAGRMLDMREMERGMLGLYLSTQPMAA